MRKNKQTYACNKVSSHLCRIFILQDVLALLQCHYKVTKGTQSEGLRKALRGEKSRNLWLMLWLWFW